MELKELEEHFSPANGWQCNYCMDIIPCDTKGMNGHLDECKEYQENHKKMIDDTIESLKDGSGE